MTNPIGEAKNSGSFPHRAEKKVGVIGRHKIALQPIPSEEKSQQIRNTTDLATRTLSSNNLFAPSQEKIGHILRGRSLSPKRGRDAEKRTLPEMSGSFKEKHTQIRGRSLSPKRERSAVEEYKIAELSERKSLSTSSSRSVSPSPRSSSFVNASFFLEKIAATMKNWRVASPSKLIANVAAIQQESNSLVISEELKNEIVLLLEQVSSRRFSPQEMEEVKGIIKRLVEENRKVSVEGEEIVEADPNRADLVRHAFSLLSQLPYEKAILLVDEQVVRSLAEHGWYEAIDKDLPRTIVLVQAPAIKSLLALRAVQSFSFDTLSVYLGLHLLVSRYKQASLEERQNFVEKLIQAHFTQGAPLQFNIRQSLLNEIREEFDKLESNLELHLGNCIKILARQTTLENDLYSVEKMALSDVDKQNLSRIEDIDGFYMHLLDQLASQEEEPLNQKTAFSNYFHLNR